MIRLYAANFLKQYLIVGLFIDIMDINILNNSIFVDYKNCPFGFTVLAQHPISLGYFPVGPEITD